MVIKFLRFAALHQLATGLLLIGAPLLAAGIVSFAYLPAEPLGQGAIGLSALTSLLLGGAATSSGGRLLYTGFKKARRYEKVLFARNVFVPTLEEGPCVRAQQAYAINEYLRVYPEKETELRTKMEQVARFRNEIISAWFS